MKHTASRALLPQLIDIDTATKKAETELNENYHLTFSDVPVEIQLLIWGPLIRNMQVLDLLDLAAFPNWATEGVRQILDSDLLWKEFWVRDFWQIIGEGIPQKIPEFLEQNNEAFKEREKKGGSPLTKDETHFVNLPWKRYYIWTYFCLRTFSKMAVHDANRWMRDYRDDRNQVRREHPPGVTVEYREYQVKERSFDCLQRRLYDYFIKRTWEQVKEETGGSLMSQMMDHFVRKNDDKNQPVLPHYSHNDGAFWDDYKPQSRRNGTPFVIVAAQYIIESGWVKRDVLDWRDLWGKKNANSFWWIEEIYWKPEHKYLNSWLIWCCRNFDSNKMVKYIWSADDDDEDDDEYRAIISDPAHIRKMLNLLADTLERSDLGNVEIPLVPRKEEEGRDKIFLGSTLVDAPVVACAVCSNEATEMCGGRCANTAYCSQECQILDWDQGHNKICK